MMVSFCEFGSRSFYEKYYLNSKILTEYQGHMLEPDAYSSWIRFGSPKCSKSDPCQAQTLIPTKIQLDPDPGWSIGTPFIAAFPLGPWTTLGSYFKCARLIKTETFTKV